MVLGIFIEQATGYVEDFLTQLASLVYPKEKIHLFVHIAVIISFNDLEDLTLKLKGFLCFNEFISNLIW